MSNLKGIDVSAHQGVIDWEKVKADGVQFAMIRAGYGTDTVDKYAQRNFSECNRLGIPCGAYWFMYALTKADAIANAKKCLEVVAPFKLEYPISCDFEYDTVRYAKDCGVSLGKAECTSFSKAFCETIENAGYYAMNYANQDYMRNMFDYDQIKKYDLWYAWYNSTINRNDAGMWQYGSTGRVAGISGNVDMNISFNDYATIIKKNGLNHLSNNASKPKPEPSDPVTPSGSVMDLATGVIAGHYGDGDARKKALGTKYDAVQSEVNHRLTASVIDLATEVMAGRYGDGDTRKKALGSRYNEVQEEVNHRLTASASTLATEVIAGRYGVGDARKKALGSRYNEVQKVVNKMM